MSSLLTTLVFSLSIIDVISSRFPKYPLIYGSITNEKMCYVFTMASFQNKLDYYIHVLRLEMKGSKNASVFLVY